MKNKTSAKKINNCEIEADNCIFYLFNTHTFSITYIFFRIYRNDFKILLGKYNILLGILNYNLLVSYFFSALSKYT